MHAIIYKKNTDEIKYVVKNCVKRGGYFVGDGRKLQVNLKFFDVMWTDDIINPILGENNEIKGWDKNVSDLNPSTDIINIVSPTRDEFKTAFKLRKLIDTMSYQELDDYIETNVVDLASAKDFIKTLAKVTLALCKLIDSK
jgi:hypothetical protein